MSDSNYFSRSSSRSPLKKKMYRKNVHSKNKNYRSRSRSPPLNKRKLYKDGKNVRSEDSSSSSCRSNIVDHITKRHKRKPYFKPIIVPDQEQVVNRHTQCLICKSYFPDGLKNWNLHLALHPDRVFLCKFPVETYHYNIESAIQQLAESGIRKMELNKKIEECNLIKFPSNLKGYSCDICKSLDTNSISEFKMHVKEECMRILEKGEEYRHLACFCRRCHARFEDKEELKAHINVGGCWLSMIVVNRIYDSKEVRSKTSRMDEGKLVGFNQQNVQRELLSHFQEASSDSNSNLFDSYSYPPSPSDAASSVSTVPSLSELRSIMETVDINRFQNCKNLCCTWTEDHSTECNKFEIISKCINNRCDWKDFHCIDPICRNLSFFCNFSKTPYGFNRYYDDLPQVKSIPTYVEGFRNHSVQERRSTIMRLLYVVKSQVVMDPRLNKTEYPTRRKTHGYSFRGVKGSIDGWSERDIVSTWWLEDQKVVFITENNPHIVVEDHDDSFVEVIEDVLFPNTRDMVNSLILEILEDVTDK